MSRSFPPARREGGEDEGLPSPRAPPSPCPPLSPWTSLLMVRRETGIPKGPQARHPHAATPLPRPQVLAGSHLPVDGCLTPGTVTALPGASKPIPAAVAEAPLNPRPLRVPAAHKHKKQDVLQPCDTTYPVFVHETAIQGANGIVECGGCQK